jgi:glycosyltransferase involved in cell wall biosynthesis
MDISVVICTHNPRPKHLRRVLQALRNQTLPLERWELLLIDNASQERLDLATWDLSWHPRSRLLREEELGLSSARMRGMRESDADLLVFVDDDNVLEWNYLSEVIRVKSAWPQLGVWGGSIIPEFEVQPPEYVRPVSWYLALREVKSPRWSNVSTCSDAVPLGAGLCVRADVAAEYYRLYQEASIKLGDRIGKDLLSSGDTEICFAACSLGFGMGVFPDLKVTHLIPKERLDEDYLVRLVAGIETSLHLVAYKWHGILPSSPFTIANLLRTSKYLMLNNRRLHRRTHIAGLRARIKARRIIAGIQNRP